MSSESDRSALSPRLRASARGGQAGLPVRGTQAGLRLGKPPLEVLDRLFRACDIRDPRVLMGPRVGEDAAVVDLGDRYLVAKV
ncbi:MAG: hypothetical protein HY713_04095, partial [candidate division NC10 bacterium]|nr:hypothetical protein [candidate division NC10 bacterium]